MNMRSVKQLLDLSDRKAVITGGAGHIGLAGGMALVELGATVGVLDIDAAACATRADYLTGLGPGKSVPLVCDLLDEKSTRLAMAEAEEKMGGLDILVHCAAYVGVNGIKDDGPFEKQTVPAWDAALRIYLTSAFVMVQEAQEALASSGHGSVIFLGSTYGVVGPDLRMYDGTEITNSPGYAASKGGVIQLGKHLATVLAPKIRVNSISPGGVWRDQPESFHQQYVSRTPMGRMASEEDLKGAIAYLASDMSAYVTGHNLAVDGGWTAW